MPSDSLRVLFLGFAVSTEMFEELLRTDQNMPVQTQRFGWNVINALRSQGAVVEVLSVEPTTDYPNSSRWYVRGRTFSEAGQSGRTLGFVNLPGLKHLWRFVLAMWHTRGHRRVDAIVLHGVHSPFLLAAVCRGHKWRVPVIPILTDEPGLATRFDSTLSTAFKSIDRRLLAMGLRGVDASIALSPRLASTLVPGKPSLSLRGIVGTSAGVERHVNNSGEPLVALYAGSLHESYGVTELVKAATISRGNWKLEICGTGPAEDFVRSQSEKCERVTYLGRVDPADMERIYARADVLVNPRPNDTALAQLSFPSKLLEYMQVGVPVISTHLPTFDTEIVDRLIVSDHSATGLAAALDEIANMSASDRAVIGKNAREFVSLEYGLNNQGRRIVQFLGRLSDSPSG